jgi:hypothetical protein
MNLLASIVSTGAAMYNPGDLGDLICGIVVLAGEKMEVEDLHW